MNKIRTWLLVAMLCSGSSAWALTKEQQVDQSLLAAQTFYKDGRYSKAFEEFATVEQVGLALDDSFHFFYAMSGYHSNQYSKAWSEINRYLALTGRSGTYYQKALELHQKLEPQVSKAAKAALEKFESSRSDWLKHEKKQRLTNQEVSAWAAQQSTVMQQMIKSQQFDAAQARAQEGKARLERYSDALISRSENLYRLEHDLASVTQLLRFKLIEQTTIDAHRAQLDKLQRWFRALDFERFDALYSVEKQQLGAETKRAFTQKADIDKAAQQEARSLRRKMECFSSKSQLKAFERYGIDDVNGTTRLRTTIRDNCNEG